MYAERWLKHTDGYWYWFDTSGAMVTGWKKIGGNGITSIVRALCRLVGLNIMKNGITWMPSMAI